MRLRIFTAPTVAAAMDKVRQALGEDAVIVHVEAGRKGGPARVTAATEHAAIEPAPESRRHPKPKSAPSSAPAPALHDLPTLLRYHGLPPALSRKLVERSTVYDGLAPHDAFAAALENSFAFRPVSGRVESQLVLVGQTGQGKTLTAARLAAMAVQSGRKARIITTDAASAGALAQLEAFCKPLGVEVIAAEAHDAERLLAQRYDGLALVDTAGVNPYLLADVEHLARLLRRLKAEPLWVFAANTEPQEAADMGEVFASLGVQRIVASRADATRRFAAVLAVLARCKLALAAFSDSPFVADMLVAGTPRALAERLIDRPDPTLLARYTKAAAL